jgi:glycosyltransferase involved in cell wall biosynthesis
LNQARVAVVPLRIARGVQNKVLEALAMSKAVVASPEPLVGLAAKDGTHLFEADSAEQWVRCVIQLLDDPSLRADIGLAGQAYVSTNHRWDQCLAGLLPFLGVTGQAKQQFDESHSQENNDPAIAEFEEASL